jgi:hypothetical protein
MVVKRENQEDTAFGPDFRFSEFVPMISVLLIFLSLISREFYTDFGENFFGSDLSNRLNRLYLRWFESSQKVALP